MGVDRVVGNQTLHGRIHEDLIVTACPGARTSLARFEIPYQTSRCARLSSLLKAHPDPRLNHLCFLSRRVCFDSALRFINFSREDIRSAR